MAENTEKAALQTSLVQLPIGMYIARLTDVALAGRSMGLSVAPSSGGVVDFFHSDSDTNNHLTSPNQSVVVRVKDATATLLVASMTPTGAEEPKLKLDKIASLDELNKKKVSKAETKKTLAAVAKKLQALQKESKKEDKTEANIAQKVEQPTPQSPSEFGKVVLVGHVEWKGDTRVNAGEWLGDPKKPSRIEGFALAWQNKPEGVDLAYSCQVKNMGKTPMALSGSYVGTRRKSLPITALTLSLVGVNALSYVLDAVAVFADGEEQALLSGVECQGVTGNEQLIALKVSVVKKPQNAEDESNNPNESFQQTDASQWTVHSV